MNISAGIFLKSQPLLNGTNFEKALIFITEYNGNGAIGFVVNQLFHRRLNELAEFKHSIPFQLYDGGPVDGEHLFFIHRRPDLIEGGTLIIGDVYLGGDFSKAVTLLNRKTITPKDVKIFVGYSGWDNLELEAEIEEGSWAIVEKEWQSVFL